MLRQEQRLQYERCNLLANYQESLFVKALVQVGKGPKENASPRLDFAFVSLRYHVFLTLT